MVNSFTVVGIAIDIVYYKTVYGFDLRDIKSVCDQHGDLPKRCVIELPKLGGRGIVPIEEIYGRVL